jgi:uncharacterized RDD family membrane protein YckC
MGRAPRSSGSRGKTRTGLAVGDTYTGYAWMFSRNLPALLRATYTNSGMAGIVDLNSGSEFGFKDGVRREIGDLSTLVSSPAPQPSWKQEVNRRLAAHKSRKGLSVVEQNAPTEAQIELNGRAAEAAARVAARYAKAPSFSEMQAAEARAALRTAEAATRVALEAQVAAQMVLANLETESEDSVASEVETEICAIQENSRGDFWETEPAGVPVVSVAGQSLEIRWEPDMPAWPSGPPPAPPIGEQERFDGPGAEWWGSATMADAVAMSQALAPVEPAQPIPANLIQFPRELVATRRIRPRLTSASRTALGDLFGQLSIFEVDPSSISIEPEAPAPGTEKPAEEWNGPKWSGIELDEQPEPVVEVEVAPASATPRLHQAPFARRLLAGLVDSALIMGTLCAAALAFADRMPHPLAIKTAELWAVGALIVIAILYQAISLALAKATPGMMYAGIALCTFDDEYPTNAQLRGRVVAMVLSLLPVGLGVVWAVFDDDHLSWHDRLSRTYQRKC